MPNRQLQAELAWFRANREELYAEHPNEWVAVKGREVLGFFPSFTEAFERGSAKARTPNILVKQVLLADEPFSAPALTLGLLGGVRS